MSPAGLDTACQIRVGPNGPQTSGCKSNDPRALHQAAQEFEALLIGQLLKSMKLSESSDGSGAASSMMDFAQDSLARLISQNGGIGLAHFLESSLSQSVASATAESDSDSASTSPGEEIDSAAL